MKTVSGYTVLPSGRKPGKHSRFSHPARAISLNWILSVLLFLCLHSASSVRAESAIITQFLNAIDVSDYVPAANALGKLREDIPVVPALRDGKTVGWLFLTSDFVSTTGYSGKPIHTLIGVDADAKITGLRMIKHSEPIVLIGIPEAKITAVIDRYRGLDLVNEASSEGSGHDLDIVSGATVTIMIIDDSIVRAGLKVSRALGLGGLEAVIPTEGPQLTLIDDTDPVQQDWITLVGNGSVRSLNLDIGQINEAFIKQGDQRAIKKPQKGEASDTFIEMQAALVSVPSIGLSLLGEAEQANLKNWLEPGEHALLLAARGKYSFKGSGYVRGGIFDRIQLIQGDRSVRFFDHQHRRLGALATSDSPQYSEMDLFRIPANSEFDPAQPFRIQLLVQRQVGAIDRAFLTFDLGYLVPDQYIQATSIENAQASTASVLGENDSSQQLSHLWPRIWEKKRTHVIILGLALLILTAAFFFQMQLTRHEKLTDRFRICFLLFTLVWLGWYANAQLSVVNVLTMFRAATNNFSWDAFLMDPLIFVLWFAVVATLLLWGRGGYCGWLCPFGALQELTNRLAKLARIPQIRVKWALNERLWAIKYLIFLGLFGLSLNSLELAERFAEVEPFKTAIILKFSREWPFVTFALGLLFIGLFIERFYCRYLCPLGAALAIPSRLRLFNWLKRYRECGNPCAICANECMVQAIDPLGRIEPNECQQCMHCQVLYQSKTNCPVCIKREKRRNRVKPAKSSTTTPVPTGSAPKQWIPIVDVGAEGKTS